MTRLTGGLFIGVGSCMLMVYSGSVLLGLAIALLVLGHGMSTEPLK